MRCPNPAEHHRPVVEVKQPEPRPQEAPARRYHLLEAASTYFGGIQLLCLKCGAGQYLSTTNFLSADLAGECKA